MSHITPLRCTDDEFAHRALHDTEPGHQLWSHPPSSLSACGSQALRGASPRIAPPRCEQRALGLTRFQGASGQAFWGVGWVTSQIAPLLSTADVLFNRALHADS